MFQAKGSSECAPGVGTTDEQCAFENMFPACSAQEAQVVAQGQLELHEGRLFWAQLEEVGGVGGAPADALQTVLFGLVHCVQPSSEHAS